MKTPMQLTLEQIERVLDVKISDNDKRFYIKQEEEAIVDAYIRAIDSTGHYIGEDTLRREAEQFFKETFTNIG